ncbi:hypothetical protein C0J52_19210, partial [Blattella germanica]
RRPSPFPPTRPDASFSCISDPTKTGRLISQLKPPRSFLFWATRWRSKADAAPTHKSWALPEADITVNIKRTFCDSAFMLLFTPTVQKIALMLLVTGNTNESNEDEFADSDSEYIPSEEDNSSNSDVNETE